MKKIQDISGKIVRILLLASAWAIFSVLEMLPWFMKIPGHVYLQQQVGKLCFLYDTYDADAYHEMFQKNGNLAAGGTVFSKDGFFYVPSDGKINRISFGEESIQSVEQELQGGIVYGGSGYCMEVRENKIIGTAADGTAVFPYHWRKAVMKKDGALNYTAVYRLLCEQRISGSSTREMASIIGLTRENRLLGQANDTVYCADWNENRAVVYRITGQYEDSVEKLGAYMVHGKILYIKQKIYFISSDQKQIQCVNLLYPEEIQTVISVRKNDPPIETFNISESENGTYICFIQKSQVISCGLQNGESSAQKLDCEKNIEGVYCSGKYFYINYKDHLSRKVYMFDVE